MFKVVLISLLIACCHSKSTHSRIGDINEIGSIAQPQFPRLMKPRSSGEHYTVGQKDENAVILRTFESTLKFQDLQDAVNVHIEYPQADTEISPDIPPDASEDDAYITEIEVYLEGTTGFKSQVFVASGGVGQKAVTLDIEGHNLETLHYVVIIFGTRVNKQ